MKMLPLFLILILSGCTTAGQQRVTKLISSPVGKAIIQTAAAAGSQAIDQFASTGKLSCGLG